MRHDLDIDIGLPPQETETARQIKHNLDRLESYINDFESAISLLKFASEESASLIQSFYHDNPHVSPPDHLDAGDMERFWVRTRERGTKKRELSAKMRYYSGWINMAGRDGAMTIFHVRDTLESVKEGVHSCTTLQSLVSEAELKNVTNRFYKFFPRWKSVRHAVAHRADMHKSPAAARKNSVNESFDIPGFIKSAGSTVTVLPQMMRDSFFCN